MYDMFRQVVPLLFDVVAQKGSVVMYDRKKYLVVKRGARIAWPVNEGDRIIAGTSAALALKTGEKVIQRIGPEVLGFPYFAIAYPIRINEEVVGGFSVGVPVEMIEVSDELHEQSIRLTGSLQEITTAVEHMITRVQGLGNSGRQIGNSVTKVREGSHETEEVIRYIDTVAKNTKLLGLNASIEAARAGEWGRGFSVVAAEIQKMALSSASSTGKIREIIGRIQSDINLIAGQTEEFQLNTQEVIATIQEIGASLESIRGLAEGLQELAQKL